ncbi:MAG: hypothetical protein AB8B85_12320 [Paracoccaceae bacterium]
MLSQIVVRYASIVVVSALPAVSGAEQLSAREALLIGSTDTTSVSRGFWGSLSLAPERSGSHNAAVDIDTADGPNEMATGGVIGLGGPFGVIVDYSSDVPRLRGLAFSPAEGMRLEATGEFNTDTDRLGGRVSVHFNF